MGEFIILGVVAIVFLLLSLAAIARYALAGEIPPAGVLAFLGGIVTGVFAPLLLRKPNAKHRKGNRQ